MKNPIKSKEVTNLFIELLNKHTSALRSIEGHIRQRSSWDTRSTVSLVEYALSEHMVLNERDKAFNDSDEGPCQVISDLHFDFSNGCNALIDFKAIALSIHDKLFASKTKPELHRKYVLTSIELLP